MIKVGQLRKWNKSRGLGLHGEYTYFLVIEERIVMDGKKQEKAFTVRYPDGTIQEYWEGDLMPGFDETYDDPSGYSTEVTGGTED